MFIILPQINLQKEHVANGNHKKMFINEHGTQADLYCTVGKDAKNLTNNASIQTVQSINLTDNTVEWILGRD